MAAMNIRRLRHRAGRSFHRGAAYEEDIRAAIPVESRAPVAWVHDLLAFVPSGGGILAPRGLESTVDAGQRVAMADNLGFGGGQFGQAGLDGGGCDKVSSQADVCEH